MARSKPVAYVNGYVSVWLVGKPIRRWEARNYWGERVGYGTTRKECEADCRRNGYTPVRDG